MVMNRSSNIYDRIARLWESLERVNNRFIKIYDLIESIMNRLEAIERKLDDADQ